MFPAPSYSYAPNNDDDLDIDFNQFELSPQRETSNPLFFEDNVPPPAWLQNGTFSGGRRQPLPTTWSPLLPGGRSSLPPPQQPSQNHPPPPEDLLIPPAEPLASSNHLPPGRPPSPSESVSDRITAMMLAPPDSSPRLPGSRLNDGPYYAPGPPGREQPPTHYRQEVPPPQLQPYPPEAVAMHSSRHAEQHPHPLPLDRTMMDPSRYAPSSGHYNSQPPPPHRVYSPPPARRQDHLPPQQALQDRSPVRHPPHPADYENVPRPPVPPLGRDEARYPHQNSPRDFGHMMPINDVPPDAMNPLQRPEYLPPQVQNDRVPPPRHVSNPAAYRTAPRPPTPPLGHEARYLPQENRQQAQREDHFPPRDHGTRRTLPANATRPPPQQQPLSSPEQKPRSRSVRENRSQQHREQRSRTISTPASRPLEKIREFAPYNPKAPSIPLPDYEGEAACEYVPKPDYGEDVVTAYVPRPDYLS
ncbi:uncharacterized protein LOC135201571 [Macrobrachium nipponense]|uniref:uncharacterized protein LOC135201571 n=1 Tax=Macrobrachium nipponense TaxID=159736 RepID=UPI0030C875B1